MRKNIITFLAILVSATSFAQIVSLSPSNAGSEDAVTVTFDATVGNAELVGASTVYMHHGVVTASETGTEWEYVIGNWGEDNGIGQMTKVAGESDQWEFSITPTIREYFNVPDGTNIFRISCVFRSADGSLKGTIANGDYGWGSVVNGDFYINLNSGNYVSIDSPLGTETYIESIDSVLVSATASADVSSMKVLIDEGSGYNEVANVNSGNQIAYYYKTAVTKQIDIKVTATIGTEDIESIKTHNVVILKPTVIEDLPAGIKKGVNYDNGDDTKVTLVLEAPGKEYAYVVGDFNNWEVSDSYQMKQTTDGEFLWLEINGLTAQQEYVFQYWVDGSIKIGDPYAEKIADPWNDKDIEESVYPNLPVYVKTENQTATVLQTGQTAYSWDASESSWTRPDIDNLVIYELLVRDFLESHSYSDLIDTLSYLKRLGVEAIELMPFNEFEGNESWGYNPSYYFAPDKYYGPKDSLKKFIETAHKEGIAVIMDIVLNHAFGQNALVKLYWNGSKPASDNPWFNEDHVGPYAWGYDFNHESDYTKAFIDSVNTYWINEYHIDGYRFDFTKGFTQYAPGGNIDGYDASRIAIIKRMSDVIWSQDEDAYIILEHWGQSSEETELGNYGLKMWRNKSYDYVPAMNGSSTGSFGSMDESSHVPFYNSHDERRVAEHALTEGLSNSDGTYNVADPYVIFERKKMLAAFTYLFPGPKMIWQFDELGYDISIDYNGRTGNKPLPWGTGGLGYYEDENRQHIYSAYKEIIALRKDIGADNLATASTTHKLSGATRRLSYDLGSEGLIVIGNFGLTEENVNPEFTQTGTWYNYFSGEEESVSNTTETIALKAGEWRIYTTTKYSNGFPEVVEIYDNPVVVTPYPFTKNTEITITFDATKAWNDGTSGLIGANKVYMNSGVVTDSPGSTTLTNLIGNSADDGIGEMTKVGDDLWEITLTPAEYYSIASDDEIYKIGMYFRDADNTNLGKGFRNSTIYVDVQSTQPFVTISPASFTIDDEITVTFNATQGNQELVGANKVYMHSGVVLSDNSNPGGSDWEHAVGNWGADDGIGEMTKVAGEDDKWEITLTPKTYFTLDDAAQIYWLAAVFRSADGNTKGTGTPGDLENGFISSDGDFFIKNEESNSIKDIIRTETNELKVYPNPATESITIGLDNLIEVSIFSATGQLVRKMNTTNQNLDRIELSNFNSGLYFIRAIDSNNQAYNGKFLKL